MSVKTELFTPSDRGLILQAAADLCADQGYAETTPRQVAERAGVPAEVFAEMFGDDLEACILAAVQAIVGEVMSAVAASYSADRSEWDSGLLGIKALLELMAANPSFARLAYIGSRQMATPRVHEAYEGAANLLSAMIDRLRENSVGFEAPRAAGRASLGAAEAVVRAEISAGRIEGIPSLLPDLAYGATVSFLGQEEALRFAARGRELLRGTPWDQAAG
jgi:AcrR family transcriptional regulator